MGIFRRQKRAASVPAESFPTSGVDDGVDPGPIGAIVKAALDDTLPVMAACQRAAKLGAGGTITRQQFDMLSYTWFRQATIQPAAAWTVAQILYAGADAAWTGLHDADSGHLSSESAPTSSRRPMAG